MTPEQHEAILSFIRAIGTAIANANLYTIDHRQVDRLCAAAHAKLLDVIAGGELLILVIDGELVANGIPLGSALYLGRFANSLISQGMGNIRFVPGATSTELKQLIERLSRRRDRAGDVRATDHIRSGKVEIRYDTCSEDLGDLSGIAIPSLEEIPELEHDLFNGMYKDLRKGETLNIAGVSEIVYGFAAALSQAGDTPLPLLVHRPDEGLRFCHSSNVCILTLAQAKALKIGGPLLHDIGVAALLHDIGNFFLLDDLVDKELALHLAEDELIRQHPERGAKLLLETPGVPRLAVVAAFEHHLGYDLAGYPSAPVGWKQNMCSHMVTISDTYDALLFARKETSDADRIAARILGMAGTRLEPALTYNFINILRNNRAPS